MGTSWAALGRAVMAVMLSAAMPHLSFGASVAHNNGMQNGIFTGNVIWGGDATDTNPVRIPLGRNIEFTSFCWTEGQFDQLAKTAKCHSNYDIFQDPRRQLNRQDFAFYQPNDPTITDWRQSVRIFNANFGRPIADVHVGNIQRKSPWEFRPLSALPAQAWRIPDFTAINATSDLTIYEAVNLDLYTSSNPNGFLNGQWSVGQTLDELGLTIVHGQIPGVQGLYFATSAFTLDPSSETGWVPFGGEAAWLNSPVFQAQNGALGIIAEHVATPIPEPSTWMLVATGCLGLGGYGRRRRRGGVSRGLYRANSISLARAGGKWPGVCLVGPPAAARMPEHHAPGSRQSVPGGQPLPCARIPALCHTLCLGGARPVGLGAGAAAAHAEAKFGSSPTGLVIPTPRAL